MGEKWFSVEYAVQADIADTLVEALSVLDPDGTEIGFLRKPTDEKVVVRAYFSFFPNLEETHQRVVEAASALGLDTKDFPTPKANEVVQEDWLAEWKKHWTPTKVGRFVVAPPWSEVEDAESIVIKIEPSMAFGTGTHETTKLCLQLIDSDYDGAGDFLDVGTGTGLLAIAAAKLSDREDRPEFFACDVDEDSVVIARQNANDNGVSFLEIREGSVEVVQGNRYNFVVANMTIDTILPMLESLLSLASEKLVVSGILVEQEAQFMRSLPDELVDKSTVIREGEWIAVLIQVA